MSDPYDDFAADPDGVLRALNPPSQDERSNCPQTTDAADDYFNTGVRRPVTAGMFDDFDLDANWNLTPGRPGRHRGERVAQRLSTAQLLQQLRRMGHGHHFVIRGLRVINAHDANGNPRHRTADGRLISATHFFVLANIRGVIWVVDPYRRFHSTDPGILFHRAALRQP